MRCKEFENKIIDYLESELSDSDMNRMKKHLEECDNCNHLYTEIKKTYELLEQEKAPELQAGFFERVQSRKTFQNATSGKMVTLNRFYAAAAAIAIMVGLALGITLSSNLSGNGATMANGNHTYYIDSIASDFYLNTEQTASLETYLVEEE